MFCFMRGIFLNSDLFSKESRRHATRPHHTKGDAGSVASTSQSTLSNKWECHLLEVIFRVVVDNTQDQGHPGFEQAKAN